MANYQYRAIDAHGNPAEGQMSASELSQLETRLQNMGLFSFRVADE